MDGGIKGLALGGDLLHPATGEQAAELLLHHLDTRHDARGTLIARGHEGLERALEVVEHREELGHEIAHARLGEQRPLALHALAEVVEVGSGALELVEVLVPLRGDPRHVVIDRGRIRATRPGRPVGARGTRLGGGHLGLTGGDRVVGSIGHDASA